VSQGLSWRLIRDGATTHVQLTGPIDEEANFASLVQELTSCSQIRLNVAGVTRINSCGVREWIRFMRVLPATSRIEIESCTPVIVSQLNMINNFAGSAKVLSVQAPYVCDACGAQESVVVDVSSAAVPQLPEVTCSCGEKMQFDDLEDSYFAFLRAGTSQSR
jgi:hypothetical protein